MIEILSATFAAGETKTWNILGARLEILDAQYPVDVFLMDKSGSQQSVMRQSEASYYSEPKGGFEAVQIKSDTAQTIRFFVGTGDSGTRRTSGVVQVVDGGKTRTLANQSFMGSNGVAPAAGQNGRVQLYCSGALTTKRMVVKSYVVGLFGGSAAVTMYRTVAAPLPGMFTSGYTKNLGAASINSVRTDSIASTGLVGYELLLLQNATSIVRKLEEPIILTATHGLVLEVQNPNIALYASFEWIEEDV